MSLCLRWKFGILPHLYYSALFLLPAKFLSLPKPMRETALGQRWVLIITQTGSYFNCLLTRCPSGTNRPHWPSTALANRKRRGKNEMTLCNCWPVDSDFILYFFLIIFIFKPSTKVRYYLADRSYWRLPNSEFPLRRFALVAEIYIFSFRPLLSFHLSVFGMNLFV